MKLTTVLRAGLLGLATTADARANLLPDLNALTPVVGRHRQVVQAHKQQLAQVQAVVPSAVVFHETNVTTNITDGNNNGTLTVLTNTTSTGESKPSNVNACTAPTYTDVSPLRTKTIRHHCEHLADKVLARAGYWEMDQWASLPAGGGAYLGLATEETCQFGIALILNEKLVHEQGSVFGHNASMVSAAATMTNATINEVAMYVSTPFDLSRHREDTKMKQNSFQS